MVYKILFSGLTCSDPGTPGNGVQIVNNYEVGQTLYYTCNHAGFEPDPKLNYTCEYSSGSAAWSNNLANNLPQCKGKCSKLSKNSETCIVHMR